MKDKNPERLNNQVIEGILSEYLLLQEDIKKKSQRMDDIRTMLKNTGTFMTANFVCVVKNCERRSLVSLDKAKSLLGMPFLEGNGLVTKTTYQSVIVTHKSDI